MRVYIQIKQLGKRKCSIEKIPIDFPVPPVGKIMVIIIL